MGKLDWGQLAAPLIYIVILGLLAVFGHAGLQGEHGLRALATAEAEAETLEAELAALEARRAEIENRVDRLGGAQLDLDLLDERARAVLGLARPDELVIH